jgi:hypothetical protein
MVRHSRVIGFREKRTRGGQLTRSGNVRDVRSFRFSGTTSRQGEAG